MTSYEEQMKQLGLQLDNVNENSQYNDSKINGVEQPYKRRIIVHTRSYYLPDVVRGMTDTVRNIWINAREYHKSLVLRHEKIHVAHPEWPESVVRQFHDFYEPFLPDVEFIYV